ncbi:PDR/VanB family oxidoreductase [Oceanobacter mangrovi]|uniref:PDR/VanB family oxidoreductase n=1 Tax=Oceanobacter mangrovi TaxID=2862510 RepID=UPI001C8D43D2|nr:PDR/VanB family oxidoreductase [Oceanobacter mangrovi]
MTTTLFPVRLQQKTVIATDIVLLTLVRPDHQLMPAFEAGAHVDLHLPNGLIRQYSLCNSPTDRRYYQLGVLLDPHSRGGSAAIHQLPVGADLMLSQPRNLFPLHDGQHHVLIAGGIGITPILCMAEELQRRGQSFELHYCVRSRDRQAFTELLQQPPLSNSVVLHIDDDPTTEALPLSSLLVHHEHRQLYVCGPGGLIKAVNASALEAGWPASQIHFEQFAVASAGSDAASSSVQGSTTPNNDFEIVIASSGQVIPVAATQSAANAMQAAGIPVELSCEQGICGSCLTAVVDGLPDHRDYFQSEAEKAANERFTPCCSRSHSRRLVVDL